MEKLKNVVTNFLDKVYLAFKDTNDSSKYKKEDGSENDDLSGKTGEVSITYNNTAQSLLPILPTTDKVHIPEVHTLEVPTHEVNTPEVHTPEVHTPAVHTPGVLNFFSIDMISIPECVVIAKPEEAGGIIYNFFNSYT